MVPFPMVICDLSNPSAKPLLGDCLPCILIPGIRGFAGRFSRTAKSDGQHEARKVWKFEAIKKCLYNVYNLYIYKFILYITCNI